MYLYTLKKEHGTGAKPVVDIIHRVITDVGASGPLPMKLYVQAGNCTKENKNGNSFEIIKSLVARKIFRAIDVPFLLIGHNHEDIDQAFSPTSERLRSNDEITLSGLHTQWMQAYEG